MPRPVNPDDFEIGRRIYTARRRKGIPQQEASIAVGMASTALSEIERGVRTLKAPTLAKIAALLDADPTFLLTGAPGRGSLTPREHKHIQNCRQLTPARFDAIERIVATPEARTC